MARGINKVIIVGNIGQDPESRTFPNGGTVTNISVATSESWKDKDSGQMKERTEWHRVVLRDRGNFRLGEIAQQYLKKGSKVYIEGKLATRKYQAQDGSDRFITEIIAEEMQMLDARNDNGMAQGATNNNYQQPAQAPRQQQAAPQQQYKQQTRQPLQQQAQQPLQQAPNGFADAGFIDDDIPF